MERKLNQCSTNDCPAGIESVRKIGLTQEEKRAIFRSIIKEGGEEEKAREKHVILPAAAFTEAVSLR